MNTDRRQFLREAGLGALVAGAWKVTPSGKVIGPEDGAQRNNPFLPQGYAYNPTPTTNSDVVSEQLAYAINQFVPNTQADGKYWGYRGQLLEMSSQKPCAGPGKAVYVFTVQGEYVEGDPIRMMTSVIHLGQNPQVSVMRDDTLSTLVDDQRDPRYLAWRFRRQNGKEVPGLEINNLSRNHPGANTEFTYNMPGDLGINLENIADTPVYEGDMRLFHRSLRFVGDPHSIHTVRQTSDGIDGHGVYETVGYRIEDNGNRAPILVAQIAMVKEPRSANGLMTRIDDRSRVVSDMDLYNEFWLAYSDGGPGWYQGLINKFKISTLDQPGARQTEFIRQELQQWNARYW